MRAMGSLPVRATNRRIVLGLALLASSIASSASAQDDTARASALFASGNAHLTAASRAHGERQSRELTAALADYTASLAIVRSRNVLYNASLALEMLGRAPEAFDHLTEYLAVPGLSETDRAEATRRREALRPRVAVLAIETSPAGAAIWVDRRDLASRGTSPLEVAVAAGEHQLWARLSGHQERQVRATATLGATTPVSIALEAEPVGLQVLAPSGAPLTLDGAPIAAGTLLSIAPGPHVVRLDIAGAPVERRFEALPGAPTMVLDLGAAAGAAIRPVTGATLVVEANLEARVRVDGLVVGGGRRVEIPVVPGEHEITVDAEARLPYAGRRTFETGERAELRVTLREQPGPPVPAIVLGVATGVVALGAAGLTFSASQALDGYNVCTTDCRARFDDAQTLGLVTYGAWALTGALAVTELIVLLSGQGSASPSEGSFALVPLPGGGVLVAGGRL